MSGADQILSFVTYNFVILPITNYLCSQPQRKQGQPQYTANEKRWFRWKGAFYVFTFLLFIAVIQIVYENYEDDVIHTIYENPIKNLLK